VRIIPTNGMVERDGNAVMGKGVAKQAQFRFPMLPRDLGLQIKKHGNHVFYFSAYRLITFPTKNDWRENSTLDLLRRSVSELKKFIDPSSRYAMPRVGCGLGGLRWEDVKPLLQELPDNVTVVKMP
jgi:hypothetical protein